VVSTGVSESAGPIEKMEVLNKFSLISYLYPKASFKYRIEPVTSIEPVFVKERNFR
jgi:hypothetical protein